ncbi:LOW QUALITY PROTEIN: uncharacterized protein LOC135468981 [Liolophura sinensis]|uniref:LOW QUALITY PROTEIN: uncharacterized protein LOC135468981 n=1 Tax=Liolophura sinensis TaxID=3198878 RepID=UPI003158E03D
MKRQGQLLSLISKAGGPGVKVRSKVIGRPLFGPRCVVDTSTQLIFPRRLSMATPGLVGEDRVVHSHHPPLNLPKEAFGHTMIEALTRGGNSQAIYEVDTGRQYTNSDLKDAMVMVASGLIKLGYKKGDVISICALNSAEYVILCLGVIAIGGTVSFINPLCSVDDLRDHLVDCKARAIATFPQFTPIVQNVRQALPNLKDVIVFGEAEGCCPFSSLLSDDGSAFPDRVDIDPTSDIVLLPYSSGTTGMPKGVMITHSTISANIKQFIGAFPSVPEDRMLCYLPLFHIFGLMTSLSALVAGVTLVVTPRFDQNMLSVLEEQRISILNLVPPVCMFLSKHPLAQQTDLSSVRVAVSGAAALSADLLEQFQSATGIQNTIQGYGMTECPIAILDCKPALSGSVGRLLPNTRAKIVDVSDGRVLGAGEKGEICLQGPQVMAGYYGNPQATNDSLSQGWLRTGDIGYYNSDGYFFIHDRLKELIKYKAFQVAPAQLEAILQTHPGVRDAAVIGVPDEEAGEVPRAFVVTVTGVSPTEEDITNFVKERVSAYKQLRGGVRFIHEIPKSASGKILRRVLRES